MGETESATPEFIWDMRQKIRELRTVWDKFPSSASQTQYAHYNNVSSMIDVLSRNVEFANDSLKR